MTLAHDYFNIRNLQRFQRLLDGDRKQQSGSGPAQPSTSGRSTSSTIYIDVNARDWLGRTPLHLACTEVGTLEYVRALLKHPNINVNLPDTESHWTPLHRALYHANLPAAQLLLQRSDIDISLKDYEGYTAFDLYNSTISGTKPDFGQSDAELFTWGASLNASLGHGDGKDRNHPDQVNIPSLEEPEDIQRRKLWERFTPVSVRQVQMSKLHTAVVTSEEFCNLRVCGFGSGGRLGPGQHTQYSLKPLPLFQYSITEVALGQDHTLALTKSGEILSWGLNRFSQLGYVVEISTTLGKLEEPIQAVPKKIVGPLKKAVVIGLAASKVASACWTVEEVFTWGTNTGQLGYDKSAHPVQISPRIVTRFSHPVISLALTDNALVALLRTQQVECIWNDRAVRINFPIHAFPSEIQPFRPHQAIKDSHIVKVTACGDVFAALSGNGEVFTFSPPHSIPDVHDYNRTLFKPQRVWALRKKFSAVRDVALGADGSIVVSTESGHVYVRIRSSKAGSAKNFKFQRIQNLQRVTHVCANSSGAFGALRVDFKPKKIVVQGGSIADDLSQVQPFHLPYPVVRGLPEQLQRPSPTDIFEQDPLVKDDLTSSAVLLDDDIYPDEESEDTIIEKDITSLHLLIQLIKREQQKAKMSTKTPIKYDGAALPFASDVLISLGSVTFPAHHVILAARSTFLGAILAGRQLPEGHDSKAKPKIPIVIKLKPSKPGPGNGVTKLAMLSVSGVRPLTFLILLHYLYSDQVLSIWDPRVHAALRRQVSSFNIDTAQIKAELSALAVLLDLPHLDRVLEAPVKRIPRSSLPSDLANLFERTQKLTGLAEGRSSYTPPGDVLLELKDRNIWTHSIILRARSEFFASFFAEDVWTKERWGVDGVLKIDLKHMEWRVMDYVLRFMLCGKDEDLFEVLPFAQTVDDVLEFMFEVMAAATELLLDRLILICSSIILKYLRIHNCCYILGEATHYHAYQLIASVQEYMATNMELLLESGMFDDLPAPLLLQLSNFLAEKQREKFSFTRTNDYIDELMAMHWDWLEQQDVPEPIVRSTKVLPPRKARVSLLGFEKRDDVPVVDEDRAQYEKHSSPPNSTPLPSSAPASSGVPTWKIASAPRVDMRAIMAEAQQPLLSKGPGTAIGLGQSPKAQGKQPQRELSQSLHWRKPSPNPLPTAPLASPPVRGGLSATRPPPVSPSPSRNLNRKPSGPIDSPGFGPTFTPSKKATPTSASTKAWTPVAPIEPISRPSEVQPRSSMSFAAIQQAQQQTQFVPIKDKRSLKEIQEEEQALQAEVDFMKWWQEEEDRVKQEMLALENFKTKSKKDSSDSQQVQGQGHQKSSIRGKGKGVGKPRTQNQRPPQNKDTLTGPAGSGDGRKEAQPNAASSSNQDQAKNQRRRKPPSKNTQPKVLGEGGTSNVKDS
ncbi:hypothetical protein FA15DRAFT_644999 [Coprinopsis marcescibilis]|uniref:BTB domain-containing protein n=1 Tax=Coprinopsis marcescibilis TaxID=230819 RepID=A0A5C3KNI7_COPMA|nr:hypothetical protein FA15DRAFT_644999 [Coprinopsis marcescibilis]